MELNLNKSDFQVIGMRRSGHHAIIHWLIPNLGCEVYFSNNCHITKNKQITTNHKANINIPENAHRLVNFEDKLLTLIETIIRGKRILVLRDPFNCIASRICKRLDNKRPLTPRCLKFDMNLWYQYAMEFTGKTNYLGGCVKINYNKWFVDKEYRNQIADKFGGLKKDLKSKVCTFSSFDGKKYQDRAEEMQVLHRWKQIKHPLFQKVLANKKLRELSNSIFGDVLK